MEEFGKRLRAVRMERKKTQKQTADMLEMRLRSYQSYEQGEREDPYLKIIQEQLSLDFLDELTYAQSEGIKWERQEALKN
mgnify:CR=1 FL=1